MNVRIALSGFALMALPISAFAGPLSKWDSRQPDVAYVSSANINDIERCLIDLDGANGMPVVYSQPDRPQRRVMVWSGGEGDSSSRIDLEVVANGTRIVAWKLRPKNPKVFDGCVPHA